MLKSLKIICRKVQNSGNQKEKTRKAKLQIDEKIKKEGYQTIQTTSKSQVGDPQIKEND